MLVSGTVYGSLTTSDPIALHRQLDEIWRRRDAPPGAFSAMPATMAK